ncbi:helix-turn-helix domain-containing protein [Vagococcus fessus]|uniref:Uncharacterized protein n=1 Tax=Vagococcus fessus TaxID=120370 RepID=A0A430A6G4_9ENTE|nr:helix-turn-helix domain-containing protein [Vagococcus fessus]RSU02469.1 hypothetical protein CBF31_08870 [Vagococcus fessus]
MFHLFLKKNEIENLDILGSTIYNLDTSLNFVNNHLLVKKSSIQHNLRQLNESFSHLGHTNIKIRSKTSRVALEGKKEDIYNNLLFDITSDYVQKSIFYTILNLMSYDAVLDKYEVSEQARISQSYLAKIMANINTFLAPTSVKLITRKGKLFYTGPLLEKLYVDYVIQCFILLFSPSPEVVSELNIPFNFFLNKFEQNKSNILTKCLLAHNHSKGDYISDNNLIQLLNLFIQINDVNHNTLEEFSSEQVNLTINLLTRLSSNQIDTDEHRALISLALLESQKSDPTNPILNDIIYISEKTCEIFDSSGRSFSKFKLDIIYLIALKVINFHLFQYNFEKLLDFTPNFIKKKISLSTNDIDHFISDLIEDDHLMPLTRDMLKTDSYDIATDIKNCLPLKSETLKLFINIKYQSSRKQYIIKLISRLFSTDSVQITNNSDEADLFVCDYLIKKKTNTSFFLLVDAESKDSINLLLNFITAKYNEKQSQFGLVE